METVARHHVQTVTQHLAAQYQTQRALQVTEIDVGLVVAVQTQVIVYLLLLHQLRLLHLHQLLHQLLHLHQLRHLQAHVANLTTVDIAQILMEMDMEIIIITSTILALHPHAHHNM